MVRSLYEVTTLDSFPSPAFELECTRDCWQRNKLFIVVLIDSSQLCRVNIKNQGRKEKTTLKLVLRSFNFIVSSLLSSLAYGSLMRETRTLDYRMHDMLHLHQHVLPGSQSLHAFCHSHPYVLFTPLAFSSCANQLSIAEGNYGTIEVQLRTVPPYVASAVWVCINAYISAKIRMRSVPLFYNTLIMVVGYIISVTTRNSKAR